jgi:hypothetical protein
MPNYVTASEAKEYSRLTYDKIGFADDLTFVTFVESLIDAAEAKVEGFTGRPSGFYKVNGLTVTDEYHDHDGGDTLRVNHPPILSVSSLARNTAGLTQAPVWDALTEGPGLNTHYLLYNEEGKIYFYSNTPGDGKKKIKLTYVAGYSAVPDAVKQVVKYLVAEALKGILKRQIAPQELIRLTMEDGGDASTIWNLIDENMNINKSFMDALSAYRKVRASRR